MKVREMRGYISDHWRSLLVAMAGGAAIILGLIGVAGLATVFLGLFNTTATTPHNPVVAWAIHDTFIHSVRRRTANEAITAPVSFTPAQVAAGFRSYVADCAICHGGPGVARASWVRQMVPSPPFVIDAARRWTPAQLYFILEHGAKMTAMPAWGETRTPAQLWEYVAFLEALPTLPPADYIRTETARREPAKPAVD